MFNEHHDECAGADVYSLGSHIGQQLDDDDLFDEQHDERAGGELYGIGGDVRQQLGHDDLPDAEHDGGDTGADLHGGRCEFG